MSIDDEDDDMGFELANGAEFSKAKPEKDENEPSFVLDEDYTNPDLWQNDELEATDEFFVTPFQNLETHENGAVSTHYDADPSRKAVPNYRANQYVMIPGTEEVLVGPNEDAHATKSIDYKADTDPAALLDKVMNYVDAGYQARQEGTTITTAFISEGKLHTANMGDSPVLVAVLDPTATPENGKKMVELKQVTTDHIASDENERKQLPHPEHAQGGEGMTWRVYRDDGQGVMLTRSMGDAGFKLNHTPEVKSTDLTPDLQTGKEVFVIVGSDGIIEHTSVEDIEKQLNIMARNNALGTGNATLSPEEIAGGISMERYSNSKEGIVPHRRNDDTTIVVQPVTEELAKEQTGPKKKASLITVADGHGYEFERTPDGGVVFDEHNQAVGKYEKRLSELATEEMQRYVESPHLMRESRLLRE